MDANDIDFRRYILSKTLHNITGYNLEPLNNELLAMELRTALLDHIMKPDESFETVPETYIHLTDTELETIVEINISIFSDFLAKEIAIRQISFREEIRELTNMTIDSLSPLWPIC